MVMGDFLLYKYDIILFNFVIMCCCLVVEDFLLDEYVNFKLSIEKNIYIWFYNVVFFCIEGIGKFEVML